MSKYIVQTNNSFKATKVFHKTEYQNQIVSSRYFPSGNVYSRYSIPILNGWTNYYILGFWSIYDAKAFICYNRIKLAQARYDNWPVYYQTPKAWDEILKKDTNYLETLYKRYPELKL